MGSPYHYASMNEGSTWFNLFDYRTPIAEWASILALFASGYAAAAIQKVKKQTLARVRLPTLLSSIERNAQALVPLMRDYNTNQNEVTIEIAKCEAHLRLLKNGVSGSLKNTAKKLLKQTGRFQRRGIFNSYAVQLNTSGDAWAIYRDINLLIEELKHAVEDQRLGG